MGVSNMRYWDSIVEGDEMFTAQISTVTTGAVSAIPAALWSLSLI